jgi:hypothetical protein
VWISEQSVLWFSFNLLSWLIGESEGKASEIDSKVYNNIVELKECRYLACIIIIDTIIHNYTPYNAYTL